MIAAAWAWVLAGVAFVIVAGLVFMVLLGAAGMPGDFFRRARQSGGGPELPDEVPTATAEETAELVDDDQRS